MPVDTRSCEIALSNTDVNSHSAFSSRSTAVGSRLTFRCVNGSQSGETIEVDRQKVVLHFQAADSSGEPALGLIVNCGQSVGLHVLQGKLLVNDVSTSDCWLQEGDVIQCGTSKLEFVEQVPNLVDSRNEPPVEPVGKPDAANATVDEADAFQSTMQSESMNGATLILRSEDLQQIRKAAVYGDEEPLIQRAPATPDTEQNVSLEDADGNRPGDAAMARSNNASLPECNRITPPQVDDEPPSTGRQSAVTEPHPSRIELASTHSASTEPLHAEFTLAISSRHAFHTTAECRESDCQSAVLPKLEQPVWGLECDWLR